MSSILRVLINDGLVYSFSLLRNHSTGIVSATFAPMVERSKSAWTYPTVIPLTLANPMIISIGNERVVLGEDYLTNVQILQHLWKVVKGYHDSGKTSNIAFDERYSILFVYIPSRQEEEFMNSIPIRVAYQLRCPSAVRVYRHIILKGYTGQRNISANFITTFDAVFDYVFNNYEKIINNNITYYYLKDSTDSIIYAFELAPFLGLVNKLVISADPQMRAKIADGQMYLLKTLLEANTDFSLNGISITAKEVK